MEQPFYRIDGSADFRNPSVLKVTIASTFRKIFSDREKLEYFSLCIMYLSKIAY